MATRIVWHQRSAETAGRRSLTFPQGAVVSVGRAPESGIVLPDPSVSRIHARIEILDDGVLIEDLGSTNGTLVNGRRESRAALPHGSQVEIGVFTLEIQPAAGDLQASQALATDGVDPFPSTMELPFPGALFASPQVAMTQLRQSRRLREEVEFLTIGGGLGSFAWVQTLRIFGVPAARIRVIGLGRDEHCYSRLQRSLKAAQGRAGDRFASHAGAAPLLYWRFPGVAIKELAGALSNSNLDKVRAVVSDQMSGRERAMAAEELFFALRQEEERIGWTGMRVEGRVLKLRQTDDQRFAIATAGADRQDDGFDRNRVVVARHVHLATGRPSPGYAADLARLKRREGWAKLIVHAYEPHDHVYAQLERTGGTVVVRGPGHVVGFVLRRLCEARTRSSNIRIVYFAGGAGPAGDGRNMAADAIALVDKDLGWMIAQGLRDGWFCTIPGTAHTEAGGDGTLLTQNLVAGQAGAARTDRGRTAVGQVLRGEEPVTTLESNGEAHYSPAAHHNPASGNRTRKNTRAIQNASRADASVASITATQMPRNAVTVEMPQNLVVVCTE